MSAQGMLRPIEAEYLRRSPGVTVTSRTRSGEQYIPPGHIWDRLGRVFGQQMLDRGILDKAPDKSAKKKEPVRAPVKAKKRGTTIISSPLATKSQGGFGATYKKRLLGD